MDGLIRKQFAITVKEQTASGGRIVISTATEDRDRDVVRPEGARIEAYLQNPVTQWAHNYRDPWATIGRTINLTVSPDGIEAEFELRPAANDADPQNVVLLLWQGGWVRTASIGFRPLRWEERDGGGFDYVEWELLEWSLVPVPANAEALRVMSKALGELVVSKYGRVLSAANEGRIARARDLLSEVLEQLSEQEGDGKAHKQRKGEGDGDLAAWIRKLEVTTDKGEQTLFACFRRYSIDIPEDATQIGCDEDGELVEAPHPDAGKTVTRKEAAFVPPIAYTSEKWGDDATYSVSAPDWDDEELVKGGEDWQVIGMSEIVLSLPKTKGVKRGRAVMMPTRRLTKLGMDRAVKLVRGLAASSGDGTTERMTPLSTLKAGDVGAIDWGATSSVTINSSDLAWVGPEGWAVVSKEADNVTSETISTGEALELGISGSGGADATAVTDADVGITPEQATELSQMLGEFVNQISDRIRGR